MSLKHATLWTGPLLGSTEWAQDHTYAGGTNGALLTRSTAPGDGALWVASSAGVLFGASVTAPAFKSVRFVYPLGGSRNTSLGLVASAQNAPDWLDVEIDGTSLSGLTATLRVEVRTLAAGTSVTPRIYNVTDAAAAGTGVACTATAADYSGTNQIQTIAVTLASGVKKYRLQGTPSNTTNPTFCIGYLELYA